MNTFLVMGIFALYVVAVSLVRLLGDAESPLLSGMKKCWGRVRGTLFHFLANVAVPLVFGIVFVSNGIVQFTAGEPSSPAAGQGAQPVAESDVLQMLRRSWTSSPGASPVCTDFPAKRGAYDIPAALLFLDADLPLP